MFAVYFCSIVQIDCNNALCTAVVFAANYFLYIMWFDSYDSCTDVYTYTFMQYFLFCNSGQRNDEEVLTDLISNWKSDADFTDYVHFGLR